MSERREPVQLVLDANFSVAMRGAADAAADFCARLKQEGDES